MSTATLTAPAAADPRELSGRYLAGGIASINRLADPDIVFTRAQGAYMWDTAGKRYIDYHAAFGPHVLGHNDPYVTEAVQKTLADGHSLYGSGTTDLEGQLAEAICGCAPFLERVAIFNSGSEATYQALRLARAATARDHVIVVQGGYNGWHNDVACNLMTPLSEVGPRIAGGEYPFLPISAGIPLDHQHLVHPVNFNDLAAVRYVAETYPTAAMILEPILQNIGILKPTAAYLQGLRALADEFGFILIFDEVKTGFRHALGGYASIAGVTPDLATYGKALANGYPIAALGGRKDLMALFADPDPKRRVLLAGTYNAHPIPTAAALATLERLKENDGEVYREFERRGAWLQAEIEEIGRKLGLTMLVSRQGSALCMYFMDHMPVDWHDLASHHHFAADTALRKAVIAEGVYAFPIATKQWSISAAHSDEDIEQTAKVLARAFETVKL